MAKTKTGYDGKLDAKLRKLARRMGRKTLQRFYYDEPSAYVMPHDDYVRTFNTDQGYRAFIRVDEIHQFIQHLPCLPRWLVRAA